MREAALLRLDLVPLARPRRQLPQLVDLPRELLALRGARGRVRLLLRAQLRQPLPFAIGRSHFPHRGRETGVAVEQVALRRRTHERLVRMLAMDVDQPLSDLAELLNRRGRAVDECPRAPAPVHDSAQEQPALVALEGALGEPGAHRRQPLDRELGDHLRALASGANHGGIRAPAERKLQGVDEDRFPRAGLPGERGETPLELEFERVDDREIADRKVDQHESCRSVTWCP